MSTPEEVIESLTAQVNELQALQSVYPTELTVMDHGVLADINKYIEFPNHEPPRWLEYAIAVSMNDKSIELLVSLPTNYPKEQPEVYVRSSCLDRTQQCLLNKDLSVIVKAQEAGEPCIYTLISWLQDNIETYLEASVCNQAIKHSDANTSGTEDRITVVFSRYWIYSHHIYSRFKRRDVINLAKENSITGFCFSGKPGIICIEGTLEDCNYCWQKIKAMNWQKILIKLMEKEEDCSNVDNMRKFTEFEEISFATNERHNDMGQLLKYLTDHDCQHAFKELFGIEGKFGKLSD
ncbi:PREDICTED: RWD domain-containing protein 2A [Cyphomyrmex costatus]|uniref:RWD domain-containing protein 2A n=1 Tax=Cyphomyrmex costatus TaxID=456900 RepID=A0A151IMC8_9HYME|nr:PREDICTED: RWD domain-containing protein 2A [Cyphomyrmex costatus]KYN06037.1 RWD domain-containing protein 2A [Cyphomyrmex costatus]